MSIYQRFAILCGLCLVSIPCSAQDGLFDGPGGLFGDPEPAPASEAESVVDEDPLAIQLHEDAQRGNLQLANAVASFARLQRWSDVNRLLARLAGKNVDPQTLAAMSQRIEPALILKIKQRGQLDGSAQAGLEKLAKAATSQAEAPARLRKAINDLASESIDTRLPAARVLLSGGHSAVAELVASIVADEPATASDDVLRLLIEFGDAGTDALHQLALYGTPPVRHRALQALARIAPQSNIVDLVTALHAADASQEEVATAMTSLQRIASIPNRESALQILTLDFDTQQDRATLTDNDDQTKTVWTVNSDRTGVTHQTTSRMIAAYRDVADSAARLRRVGGLSANTLGAVLSADMAYRVMVDPDWGDPEQTAAIREAYGAVATGAALSAAIERSLELNDHTATIGLMRLIDAEKIDDLGRDHFLVSDGVNPTPLVRAASSPEPRVRYDAALLVSRIAAGKPFAGSSYVRHSLGEMKMLSDRPSAILVETRSDVIIPLEAVIGNLGHDLTVVGSVGELQRCVDRGGDLRLILSKTELADLSPLEMTDVIRRATRGQQIPIVFYGAEPPGVAVRRWEAPTVWIDRPASIAGLHQLRDTIRRRRRLSPLTVVDRQTYRNAATELLAGSAVAG